MKPSMPHRAAAALTALAAAGWPADLLAQPAAPEAPASAPAAGTTEAVPTIEISAQRELQRYRRAFRPPALSAGILGERDVLDTPFSVNAFNRELFELQQAVTASDVLKNDPSVTSSSTPGDSALYAQIRGFDAGGLIDGLQHEAIRPNQRNASLFNVERIDLLKGVSAFLLGGTARMPIGGAVNYIVKRPTAEPLTQLTVGFSERERGLLHGDFSRRFGDDARYGLRLNLATQRGATPIDGQRFRTDVGALAAEGRLAPSLTLRAAFEHYEAEDRAYRDRYGIDPGIAVPRPPDARTNHTQRWAVQFNRGWWGQFEADWTLAPDWRLTARYLAGREPERGYFSSYAQIVSADGGLTIFPGVSDGSLDGRTADLLLRGHAEWAGTTHELTFNASRSYSRFEFPVAPQDYAPVASNLYEPVFVERPAFAPVEPVEGIVSRSSGLAVSDIVGFGPRWSALLGLRHQRFEGRSYFNPSFDNRRTSPVAALMWKPMPQALLYLHRAEGLESGPVAPETGVSNPNEAFPARVAEQWELGVKWESRDKLLLSATLFDLRRPLAFAKADEGEALPRYVVEGEQRHRGAELLVSGPVHPSLSLIGGLTWIDARQRSTGNPMQDGLRVPGVARLGASLTGDWRVAALPGLGVYGGVFRFDRQYVDALNEQSIPSWTRLDAGVRYRLPLAGGTATTLLLNVDNLLDRRYWASAGAGLQLGTPRTWRVSARFDL